MGRADRRTTDTTAVSWSECVICALCSQQLVQQVSQLLSELEENRGFCSMQQEDDMEEQGTDETARWVYKNIPLQLDLFLVWF